MERRRIGWALVVVAALLAGGRAGAAPAPPLGDLSIEELMALDVAQVSGASRFEQRETEAPASVSVITAEEIRRFGWRTLADVLRSVRGVYVNYDHAYSGVGVRGFGALADYNGRVLLLLDGHRINEPLYDSTPLGRDGLFDLDVVERIEIVRGSSSSLYGSNAFFGVVNVITRRGGPAAAAELRAGAASLGAYEGGLVVGAPAGGGLEILGAASALTGEGRRSLRYPAAAGGERVQGQDAEQDGRALLKLTLSRARAGTFVLEAAASARRKEVPTDMYGQDLGDPRNFVRERRLFVDGSWRGALGASIELTARAYLDVFAYDSGGAFAGVLNRDFGAATWAGGEAMLVARAGRHVLTVGGEARDLLRCNQRNYDAVEPRVTYLDLDSPGWVLGAFAQDEITVGPARVNVGVRQDRLSDAGSATSPRAAFIWQVGPTTTVKLLYGRAYRAPNSYEAYYQQGDEYHANPDLRPERIESFEAVAEQRLGRKLRLLVNGYRYDVRGLVTAVVGAGGALTFENVGRVRAAGVEAEIGARLGEELEGRASYALQRAEDGRTGEVLFNSPRHLAKANVVFPLWPGHVLGAVEGQFTDRRRTHGGTSTGEAVVLNASVLARDLVRGLDVSASLWNLLGATYAEPTSSEFPTPAIRHAGATYRLALVYRR